MDESNNMREGIKNRKPYLIASAVTLVISLCVVFPFESNRSNFIEDLGFTFLTLGIAMLLGMYGLMGKAFFKGILFLISSVVFSFFTWFFFYPVDMLSSLVAVYLGIPSGVIAGLIFLMVNTRLSDQNRYKLFFKRLISYTLILLTVSILFDNGGDWMFEISEYIKSKR